MNTFRLLWQSISQLAASCANLADTLNGLSHQIRQRAGLDEEPLVIENGEPATKRVRAKP